MDYIAGTFALLAVWTVGNKNKRGFIYGMICNVLWISYAIINHQAYGLFIECVPILIINVRNYIKWSREEREGNATAN